MRDQDGVVRDVRELHAIDQNSAGVFHQDAVVGVERRERLVAGWERRRFFESGTVAVDSEIVKLYVAAAAARQNRAAFEAWRGAEDGLAAENLEVVGAVGDTNFGSHLDDARRQIRRPRERNGDGEREAEDQTLF